MEHNTENQHPINTETVGELKNSLAFHAGPNRKARRASKFSRKKQNLVSYLQALGGKWQTLQAQVEREEHPDTVEYLEARRREISRTIHQASKLERKEVARRLREHAAAFDAFMASIRKMNHPGEP